MSLAREDLLLLMAYADGELDEPSAFAERARAEALIAKSDEARAIAGDFSAASASTGDWVREAAAASPHQAAIASFDIADAVMQEIASHPHTHAAAPIDLAARRRQRAARTTGILATLAVAAAALFVVHARSQDDGAATNDQMDNSGAPTQANGAGTALGNPASSALAAGSSQLATNTPNATSGATMPQNAGDPAKAGEIEVNAVDARQQGVTVFYPKAGDTTASVVVWMDDSK
jgi:hypothetical protein